MQERHKNRRRYFCELAETSRSHFMPYISRWHEVGRETSVLEIGCGEGGNLLPFAKAGAAVTGIDIASCRIEQARRFFSEEQTEAKLDVSQGSFICCDIFRYQSKEKFDIIICHDVLEHLRDKERLLSLVHSYLKDSGIAFISFPAWQMPFGGHQQISRSRLLSHLPFVPLLPLPLYKRIIRWSGESNGLMDELLSIRSTRITVEAFERLVGRSQMTILDRTLYLINPHYKVKFGLPPCKLPQPLSCVPYLRDVLSSSCFYLLLSASEAIAATS